MGKVVSILGSLTKSQIATFKFSLLVYISFFKANLHSAIFVMIVAHAIFIL